jgi:hypothetical protein
MISLGNGQTTNTAFIGIMGNHGSTPDPVDNIYHNSINIEGTVTSGALSTFCFLRGDLTATSRNQTVDIKDNIFTNTRTGGTGRHFAIANNFGATSSATGWAANASNYNVLNAAPATVGYWTADQTFAGWQAASASDLNSMSGVSINYVNAATGDLHIQSVPAPPIESAGIAIPSVTVDFDNQNRAAFSPTDIGADFPIMSYTPLSNVCATGARTLTATITDPDGVPTAGIGLPVLYWRINAGAYTGVQATYIGSNQYQFTFGGSAVIGDVVSYYIVAQDNAGNVGSSPNVGAGGFTINPPAAATPPTSPNTYTLLTTMSGTYTVGVGGNFTTLTAAVNAYNTNCIGGAIIFNLIDATYPSETYPITINQNASASAVNTLTIKPAATATLSGSVASGAMIRVMNNYTTIDGSNNGSSSRDLTITNTNITGLIRNNSDYQFNAEKLYHHQRG